MRETRLIMGMPITIAIVDDTDGAAGESAFQCFEAIDRRFSPYKADSEVSALNRGDVLLETMSDELREVLDLSELTRHETQGYFDIRRPDGRVDPSGLVKGWAIRKAARRIQAFGRLDYFVDAGGDVQCRGLNEEGEGWRIGIRNPFNQKEIVKVLVPGDAGVATSGTYVRGQHIYDPYEQRAASDQLASMTIVAPDIYDADRFATAAFAMGRDGIGFIQDQPGMEGYAISRDGVATMTSGFNRYALS